MRRLSGLDAAFLALAEALDLLGKPAVAGGI